MYVDRNNSLDTADPSKMLPIALWLAQVIVAVLFCMAGYMKLTTSISELTAMMPWTGALPTVFVRFISIVDLAGGMGILLPALTRVLPRLTVLAALGCVVLQILAIGFHAFRGEFSVLPLNFVLLPLATFVLWGRGIKAPIEPRR